MSLVAVLVTGSRRHSGVDMIRSALRERLPDLVIHGAAAGADDIARRWCADMSVNQVQMPAPWGKHGKAAGPFRNTKMLSVLQALRERRHRGRAVSDDVAGGCAARAPGSSRGGARSAGGGVVMTGVSAEVRQGHTGWDHLIDSCDRDAATDAVAGVSFRRAADALRAKKAAALASAKFPVEGLGFDELGPTLHGAPLEQASQAEKLRLSVAIGAALNPRLRVMLLRDGSVLDDDGMRLLAELAQAHGLLWCERVGDRDASAIIIEDGMVRGAGEASGEGEAAE